MKRILLCLVAGAALLPAVTEAKDCCKPVKCKKVKVKCCQPVKQTCCQQAAPACGAAGTAAPLAPSAADVKKPYEEKAAPPPPAEKPAEKK